MVPRPSRGFLFHSASLFPSSSERPPVPPCLAFSGLRDFSLCPLRQEILPRTPRLRADYPFELVVESLTLSLFQAGLGVPPFFVLNLVLCGLLGLPLIIILGMTCLYPLRVDRQDRSHIYFHQGLGVLSPKASTWPELWEVLIAFAKQNNEGRRDGVF